MTHEKAEKKGERHRKKKEKKRHGGGAAPPHTHTERSREIHRADTAETLAQSDRGRPQKRKNKKEKGKTRAIGKERKIEIKKKIKEESAERKK